MRAALLALSLAGALPLAGCFTDPAKLERTASAGPLCSDGVCVPPSQRACASIESRETEACAGARHTGPLPTAITRDDQRRQEKDLAKRAR